MASYRKAITARPHAGALRLAYAGWLIRAERYADAEHELREVIRLGHGGAQAHRLLARALANQGQSTEALAQFQAAVQVAPREAKGHRDLARSKPAIARVRESIEQCVRAYMETDAHHPLLSRKCVSFRFAASWSYRLQREGFHTNHVHPKGWISSCYYVSLPDVVKNGTDQQGWIKFGESSLRLGEREQIAHTVQPTEGLLVLFPSYMFHGTVPFDSQQMRTTIAFDVIPDTE